MTKEELERIDGVARELIQQADHEIERATIFTNDLVLRWMQNTKKLAETILWLCDELKAAKFQ